jgi:hypothetical protein
MHPITAAFLDWYRRYKLFGQFTPDASVAVEFYIDVTASDPELFQNMSWLDVYQVLLDSHAVFDPTLIDDKGNVKRLFLH